jgi:light-regulated signal transduction histidine kinase (bacteriophytochrome)
MLLQFTLGGKRDVIVASALARRVAGSLNISDEDQTRIAAVAAEAAHEAVDEFLIQHQEFLFALEGRTAAQRQLAEVNRGVGLGLYIASEIVRGHAGNIKVESSHERGTTFTVHLPRNGPME